MVAAGMIATWIGTTISATTITKTTLRPGNSIHARAYAPNAPSTTTRIVDGTVIRTVFHSESRIRSFCSTVA